MSFHVDIQTAPSPGGTIADPSAWSGGGGSDPVPTQSGVYSGKLSPTYTFTVDQGGIIGTNTDMEVSWADGEGNAGTLYLGTDAGYVADKVVQVHEGFNIAFGAGTLVASATFTVAATAATTLGGAPVVISGTADPSDVAIASHAISDSDDISNTEDGREVVKPRSTSGRITLGIDWMDDEVRDKLLYMKSARKLVCIGENYDEDTVFLMHGGGLQPFIGTRTSFTAAGVRTYQDARTGLLRSVAADAPRIVEGQAGRAFTLEDTTTNLFTQSSGKAAATFWTINGAATTLSYDTTILGPFEPSDDHWDSDFTDGVTKMATSSSLVLGTDHFHSNDATVLPSVRYSASAWLRGRGEVAFRLRAGNGAADTLVVEDTIQLTSTWTRYTLIGVTVGLDDTADIAINPQEAGVCYAWGWQLEQSSNSTSLIQTNGGTVARAAESITLEQAIPVAAGSLSFWMLWPGPADTDGLPYTLVDATGVSGSEQFRLGYTHSGSAGLSFTTSTTALQLAIISPFTKDSWQHIVLTWEEHASTDSALDMKIYLNKLAIGVLPAPVSWEPFFGTGFNMASTTNGMRIEDLRIDQRAWTQAEVDDQYNRLTSDDWLHVHRAHAGRMYRIESISERWLDKSRPDLMLGSVSLVESNRADDSVILPA